MRDEQVLVFERHEERSACEPGRNGCWCSSHELLVTDADLSALSSARIGTPSGTSGERYGVCGVLPSESSISCRRLDIEVGFVGCSAYGYRPII